MNDICGSTPIRLIKNGELSDAWWTNGIGYGHTYYKYSMYLRLDYIRYSKDFECTKGSVLNCKASDHYSIIADFKLK